VETLGHFDNDSLEALAFDVVSASDLGAFDQLRPQLLQFFESEAQVLSRLATIAVSGSSHTMAERVFQLMEQLEQSYPGSGRAINKIIEKDDLEMAKLVSQYKNENCNMQYLMQKGSYEMVYLWLNKAWQGTLRTSWVDRSPIFAMNNPFADLALAQILEKHYSEGFFAKSGPSLLLHRISSNGCSVVLGETALELGADVNDRGSPSAFTPLQKAAQKTTREAAEFMKLLLLFGADPTLSSTRPKCKKIAQERGAQNISKWLGMDWDELIEWAHNEREAKLKEDSVFGR
jgi:hypothetical protein